MDFENLSGHRLGINAWQIRIQIRLFLPYAWMISGDADEGASLASFCIHLVGLMQISKFRRLHKSSDVARFTDVSIWSVFQCHLLLRLKMGSLQWDSIVRSGLSLTATNSRRLNLVDESEVSEVTHFESATHWKRRNWFRVYRLSEDMLLRGVDL
jgi:hypothetical protein